MIYKEFEVVYCIEKILSPDEKIRTKQKSDFEEFIHVICQVMLALKEARNFKDVHKRQIQQYCTVASLDDIMTKASLIDAYQ